MPRSKENSEFEFKPLSRIDSLFFWYLLKDDYGLKSAWDCAVVKIPSELVTGYSTSIAFFRKRPEAVIRIDDARTNYLCIPPSELSALNSLSKIPRLDRQLFPRGYEFCRYLIFRSISSHIVFFSFLLLAFNTLITRHFDMHLNNQTFSSTNDFWPLIKDFWIVALSKTFIFIYPIFHFRLKSPAEKNTIFSAIMFIEALSASCVGLCLLTAFIAEWAPRLPSVIEWHRRVFL